MENQTTIYAKTLNPEYFDYYVYDLRDDDYNDIIIDGGRDFISVDNNEYLKKINAIYDEYGGYEYEVYYHNSIKEFLGDMLPKKVNGKPLAPCELMFIKNALESEDKEKVILACLKVITGKEYVAGALRGCSQGDYVDVYYPKTTSQSYIDYVEALFFGTGTEIEVHDIDDKVNSPEDIEGFTFYTASWREEDLKREIRKACGHKPDDKTVKVVLWLWDGYIKTSKYKLAD